MNVANNEFLRTILSVWDVDGDLMRCRLCKRALIASRDGEALNHAAGCKNATHKHPWQDLREAMKE